MGSMGFVNVWSEMTLSTIATSLFKLFLCWLTFPEPTVVTVLSSNIVVRNYFLFDQLKIFDRLYYESFLIWKI